MYIGKKKKKEQLILKKKSDKQGVLAIKCGLIAKPLVKHGTSGVTEHDVTSILCLLESLAFPSSVVVYISRL